MTQSVLGFIGGSGLYSMPALKHGRWETVASPWGAPSDQVLFADIDGLPIRFLPRHGRGHKVSPSAINFRANIDVLKRAGVTDLVSISACGSLKEELPPGHFVIVDQFIDRTFAREKSFFGPGCVAHVSMADPVSPLLADALEKAARAESIGATRGGTYLVMEGPQFSTRAESDLYRAWGCSVIGMTNMPEAKLAREAEILLRDRRHGHRLRLLARRLRPRRCGGRHQGAVRERGQGQPPDRAAGPLLPARASVLPDRLRPRAGRGGDHPARGARSGAAGQARRGGGAGAGTERRR